MNLCILLATRTLFASSFPTQNYHNRIKSDIHLQATKSQVKKPPIEYGNNAPYAEANYDPEAAEDFYKSRRLSSLVRLTQLLTKTSGFVANTILDAKVFEREEQMVDQRSQELLELVSDLGPTFIKGKRLHVLLAHACGLRQSLF